ncbi:efflux RND transporter periplasmic adaptor subunit [Clostridium boliviensis]|uniref:Efflux RND transporter periplasmic adaptor subunit n=1 Tax=Clostridium boliviensis TaxID=318465 RepID=A0ABU4GF31_9CLOT|nr:efflux RND transporter periplasmic adaptor subunit [Clostridium boliviensis]MDW2796220.1 efflux RND transporter periplasmic adaptor subunit [Clostridium boliviensis]
MKWFKKKIDEEVQTAEAGPMEDDVFEKELEHLMSEEHGKKKKKKLFKKKWSKKKKIIVGSVAAVLFLFIAFNSAAGGKSAVMPVTVTPLKKGEVTETLSVSGPVQGTDSVEVVSNLHAEILDLPVKEGDKVEKGQLLATLDDKDAKKEVDIAQNAYDLAVSTYKDKQLEAENGYAKAKQDYETAKANYNRTLALYQGGSATQVELEGVTNTMNDAAREITTYTLKDGKPVANESYTLQIEKEAFELQQKKEALENTKVISPISGTVVRVNCKVGRFADKTDDDKPMFIINNLDVLEMKINVSEYSIGKVKVGQPVEIGADILNGDTVKGEVTAISPTGEEKGGGSTERVIPTTIRIIDQNSKLIAGITAKAKIELQKAEDVWVVPISALIQNPDGSMAVASVVNNTVKYIPVKTGVESDIEVEIIPEDESALSEGLQLIEAPSSMISDGMAVHVLPSQS